MNTRTSTRVPDYSSENVARHFGDTEQESSPPAPGGLIAHVLATLAAAGEYFAARLHLLVAESKEAGLNVGIGAGLAAGALCLAVLGYLFLVIALVFAIAAAIDSDNAWLWVAGGAALFHFGVGAGLAYLAYLRVGTPLFPVTISELQADSVWLHQTTKKR